MMASNGVVTLGEPEVVVMEADPLDREVEILSGANSDGEELVVDAQVEEATQSDVTRGERQRTVANAMIGSGCDDDAVETSSNFSAEYVFRTAEGGDGDGDGMVMSSRDTAECDPNYFSEEGFKDSSREENSLCCARESCTAPEDDGDNENAHTNLRLIEVNILGLELLVEGFASSYVKTDWQDGIRARLTCLVEELRELSGQIADEDGKLLCTMETSPDKASCLLKNDNQSVEESKERSNVAARLHLALEQLQTSTKQKLLPSVDVKGIEQARHKPKSSRDDADILQLEQQLQDLADENTRLANRVEESSQVIENLWTKEAQVKGETAALVQELQRRKVEILQELGLVKERVEVLEEAKEECTSVIEDLKWQLQRLQEENTGLKSVFNESSQVTDSSSMVDECAGERAQLLNQLDSVLEDKQKRAEQLVENLQKSEEGVHTVEAENKMLLSQINELTIILRRLEEEKNSLATRFDEHSQALQDALGEKVWLADRVSKLEQEIQSSEGKFLSLSSELQATQDQLTASIKCEQLVVYELKQNKEQREEENLKLTINLQDLQVQLQALREENTHVVIKASKLDQLVEELKSDKLRLGSNLELLVRDGQRREQELRSDLGTWMEQVQRLEAEKLTSVTLVDNLNTEVGRLVEDNERLMSVSSETSQSLHRLWEENRQFIEELNKLEQEKQAQEGEKMELVAGLQEIWEQLQAANNREADIVSELKSLSERREFEEYTFIEKVKGLEQQLQDLEQQLQSVCDEKADISTKFVETTKVLEEFRQETSQKLSEMLEAKVLLENEVVQLTKMKHELEEDNAREQTALYNQIQGLESEKAESLSTIEDLSGRVCASEDEINNHVEHIAKLKQFIQELHEENTRLGGEINKLEEVKERHEGERLELASELQAAWDQIQAVRESEANLATELSEVKELRAEEKVRFDGLLEELQLQLKEVMEQKIQSGMKVEELTKRLHELQKEQDLQDENGRLVSELSLLEQEKEKLALEGATLFRETQTLKDRVQTLEMEKNTLASEVEELNQWLQKPAAEKRQLASKLDEMTHSVQRLELEKTQLSTTITQLQNERERKHDELERLNTIVMSLEEEKSELVAAHELTLKQLQSLEGLNLQIAMMHEHVEISNEKVHILEDESKSMASLLGNAQVRLQALEDEKTQLENLLEGQTALANEVQMENSQLVSDARKCEQELEVWQAERQLLKSHVSNLEQEMVRLVEEDLMLKQELVELKEQFKCVIEVKDNHVEELKTNLEQYKQLLMQIEGKETHLLWGVQKLNLDTTERDPNLCQDLDSLLRNVGEEREKVAREHGLCLENRNLVSDLCGQLDGLLQRVKEEKLKVAVDLSTSKHQIRESRSFMEDEPTLDLDKDRQHETVLASENGDTCIDMEALKQMLQGCLEEKLRLEKDVTRLSLSLEESQSQLQVLATRHSTMNPQLHSKVQGWEDSQNFDQDDDSYDMAPPIHSIDDKYVTNYVREVEAKAYGKALDDPLDQGPDSPAWFKKENCRTTTMDSYLQVHSMELLQQEKDAAIYAEEVARAKLELLLLHLGKAEKGNNDLAIVVEELKDECSVLKQEKSILIDKLVKVSEGSSLAAARISNLTSELQERILKFEKEESDFRVQIARVERERDSSLVATQGCDFTHCDIAQKAQEELGRLRSDLTKLLQEYETLTCQADYDSKQLKVLNVEKSDLLAHVCLLKEETCSDKNEIVSSLSVEVSSDCEAPKLVTEAKSLEPGTPHQRHRNVVMEKNVEAVADRLESSMSDVICNTSLGSTLTVSCSCDILDSLHRILLREISSTRRHLEQVQSELMEHKQHFAIFQKKLESSVLLLFPETVVTRSNGVGRLYELSDYLINVLLRECSKTNEKLQPHQLAEVDILMEKAALVEKDTANNVGPIGSEKGIRNCNMAALFSPSEDANLIVDLSNMNTYALQSTVKEAMDLKDLIPEEKKGELTTLMCTMDRTIDVDGAPQLESSGEVGEESEGKLVLQRAMQTMKSLESELEFKKRVSSNLQEYLLERNSYIQLLEATFDKYNWPDDYPASAPLVDKIEWFGRVLACTEEAAEKSKEQMEIPEVNCESHNSSKELLVAKLAAFGKQVEKEPERDAVLGEALQKIESLESELEFKKSVSANLQEYLLERNSYIQQLEATIGKYNWPHDYPVSAPLVHKIEYFGKVLACPEGAVGNPKEQMEVPGGNCQPEKSSKEVLVAKLAAFGKEVEKGDPGRDAVLGEALQKMETLEGELEFKKSVSANLQEYLLERNSYIQQLEAAVGKYNWPHDYPVSAPLVDKIEWFGKVLACTEDAVGNPKEQMEVPGGNCQPEKSSKEVLVAKLAAFGKEVEKEDPGRGAVLGEALQKIESLEGELEFKKSVSANLQENLLERNSYIQQLEAAVGKYNWPHDYPVSAPLVDKIEWFGKVLACTEDAVGNPKEQMEVPGGNCQPEKSSKEVLVAKLAAFGKEVEDEEPESDTVLVPQESQEELQYPHSISSPFDSETKSKKRSFLSVSKESMQEVEATFRKFSWPNGYPANAPVCGKIEWLARFFVPSTSAVARESLDYNPTLPDGISETTTPVCKKMAVRHETGVESSAEKLDSNATLEQVQERLTTLQDQRTSSESEMDATTVCSCSRGSSLEGKSFIQPVEGTLEKCVWANDHTSPATLTDQVEWLAEAFSAMKPEVVRKSMGAETAEIFLTKLSYVTGLREALAGDRSFMASPTDSKYSQSGSAVIGSPIHIFSMRDMASVSKNDDNTTEYELTSLQQSLEVMEYNELLESTFQKFSWSNDYPSNASLVNKIEWLGKTFGVREARSNDSQISDRAEVETVQQLGSYIATEDAVAVDNCKEAETISKSNPAEVDCADVVHGKLVALEKKIRALEGELDFKRDVSSGLLQSLMERNSYIQAIEVAVGKFDWPEGYPSGGSLMDKIEWVGSTFTTVDGIGDIEEENFLTSGSSGDPESSMELFLALKETLVAKQAAFTRQASREKYEKDAALRQTRDTIADLESTISVLENDLEYNRGVSSGLQESLVESNGYIQMVEGVLGKFNWPGDYPLTESLSNRIQWLGETFGSVKQGVTDEANEKIEKCNGENDFYTPSKEILAAKLVALTTQFSEQKSERDVALLEAHKRIVAMEKSIVSLESELEVKKGVSSALQQSLLEENRYIQMVEGTLDKCCWPDDYPSTAPLNDKIEWLVEHLASANEELGTYKKLSGVISSSLSELSEKTVLLNTELSCVNREKEALAVKCAVLADQIIEEISVRDAALQEANERVGAMQCSINVLEGECEQEKKSLCDLQRCFQEKSIQLDLVEDAVSKMVYLEEFPSAASVNDQIRWLANTLISTQEEVDRLRTSSDLMSTAQEELHRKADTYRLEKEVLDMKLRELSGNEQLVCTLQKALSSRELELAELSKKVTEVAADVSAQETENQSLLQEGRRTHAELEDAKRDKDALEMEVSEMNQKLSIVREKLGVAVSEGKLIEKQRDFLKQELEEKITELESSNVGHIQVLQVKDAELSDIKLKLEQSEEQRDLFVSTLQEALVESPLPVDLNSMEPLDVIDWLVREYVHGKGTISLWMKRAEDSEKQVVADHVKYESDLEDTIKELRDIKLKLEQSEEQCKLFVSALQEALVECSLPADLKSMEPLDMIDWLVREYVHGKETISLWMKRAEDSEKQVVADRVKYESDLEDTIKELQDIKLKLGQSEEQCKLFVSALHEALVECSLPADLKPMEPLDMIDWLVREYVHGKETISLWMKRVEDSEKQVVADRVKYEGDLEDTIKEAMSHSSNFSIRIEELEDIIQQKDNSLRTMELAQGQVVSKCSDLVEQLRESRRQCDVLAAELDKLPETLRNKENDIIRLQDEAALMAGSSAAHVQSFREVSLDVGEESDDFFIDPRHGFKTLVNSRNIPNATHSIANQFDLLCFGAGRLFMRQPMARLALAAYWIFIHVWMAYFSLSATKYTKITHL